MELEANQISRLLEYAAMMSSAQEAVTGSSKLDMAGVMAALALARQEEAEKSVRGQKSFLHNNFTRRSSPGLLVRAERVQTELEEPDRRQEKEEKKDTILQSGESSAGKSVKTTSKTSQETEVSTASISLSSPRPVVSPVQSPGEPGVRKKVSECRAAFEKLSSNGISSSSSSLESSPRQDKKWSGSVNSSQTRYQTLRDCESNSHTTEKQQGNTTEKHRATPNTPNTNMPDINKKPELAKKPEIIKTPDMSSMAEMSDMAGFLTVVEKLSEEKERRTGNGRLDMTELVSALNNFQSTPKSPAGPPSPSTSPPPLPARPSPRSAASPPCPPPPPPSAPTPSLSSRREMSCSLSQTGAGQTTKRTKSGFLQSQLELNNEQQLQHTTSNTKPSYAEEKNSLLGELKSRLNKENTTLGDGQQSVPRRNLEIANPSQDQIVNKIVYSQYREMLNSYRSNK